jgi:hypothetical protein
MSTAEWRPGYADKVFAGYLSVQRAAWKPNNYILRTQTSPNQWLVMDKDPLQITKIRPVGGGCRMEAGAFCSVPEAIDFRDVLRISRNSTSNRYSVWFTAGAKLRRLDDVQFNDSDVVYESPLMFDSATKKVSAVESNGRIQIGDLEEYVSAINKIPADVSF